MAEKGRADIIIIPVLVTTDHRARKLAHNLGRTARRV